MVVAGALTALMAGVGSEETTEDATAEGEGTETVSAALWKT